MEFVLQGPLFPGTLRTVEAYLREEFIDRVILACWVTDDVPIAGLDSRIQIVRSEPPERSGQGNVNYQIVSSARGLTRVTSECAAKLRTDQRLTSASLRMIREFVTSTDGRVERIDAPGAPTGPLYVIGAYEHGAYPFHPQDHVFWGATTDLCALFDAPLSEVELDDPARPDIVDYRKSLRANLYLGAHYHARFDTSVGEMIASPADWLLDGAPRYSAACERSSAYRDQVFKVVPRVELEWEKRQWASYPFDLGTVERECWHEGPW